jgi:glycerol-3-phosphate acyltransferase PlsY
MTPVYATILLSLTGYLVGSLPFGVWVGRMVTGLDIRAGGSGHSGATNTLRQAGLPAAAAVVVLDVGKGFAAAWLAKSFGPVPWAPALATAAAVGGHCWPVFAGFRGGMGLGTIGGALLALSPLSFAVGLALAIAGTLLLRHSARGNVLAGLLVGPALWLLAQPGEAVLGATLGGAIIALRSLADWHRVYRELWLDRAPPT